MALSPAEARRNLARGKPDAVYLVLGQGRWERRRILDLLRRTVVGDEPSPWAESRGRAGECDPGALLDAARTLPMGAERRFIAITGVEGLKPADLEPLATYAEHPSGTSCLVLEGDKLPSTNAAARRLRAAAVVVDCPALRPYQVAQWLGEEIRGRGLTVGAGAPEKFKDLLGDDPEVLIQGLEKVLLYLGSEASVVHADAVEAVLSPVPHGTVWEFIEALEERNRRRALAALDALLEQGEMPEGILRLVARSRRQMLAGLGVRRSGGGDEQVLEAMGVHPRARAAPRVRRAILKRLGAHGIDGLAADVARLLVADSDLKGAGAGDARGILTGLVLELLSGDRRNRSRRPA